MRRIMCVNGLDIEHIIKSANLSFKWTKYAWDANYTGSPIEKVFPLIA